MLMLMLWFCKPSVYRVITDHLVSMRVFSSDSTKALRRNGFLLVHKNKILLKLIKDILRE
jgi:hypothetical protein